MATTNDVIECARRFHGLKTWELFAAAAYYRRVLGPQRHPWRASRIAIRYEQQIARANAKLDTAAKELAAAEFARYIGATFTPNRRP